MTLTKGNTMFQLAPVALAGGGGVQMTVVGW